MGFLIVNAPMLTKIVEANNGVCVELKDVQHGLKKKHIIEVVVFFIVWKVFLKF